MKTTKKQTQCEELARYLKKHRSKGITTMEASRELGITCVHKRIAELEDPYSAHNYKRNLPPLRIARTKEKTDWQTIVTRYKLAR